MEEIRFVDTTIRDGHQSLWAMNMRTSHMLKVLPYLDAAGFEGIEFFAKGAGLKKLVRHLNENPWDWIRGGAAIAKRTPLRWHGPIKGRTMSGYVPIEVGELLIKKAVDLDILYTRVGDIWNNFDELEDELIRFRRLGMTPVVNIIYSVSPRHTDEYFVDRTREAAALNPYRLCFKDVGGLLTPDRVRELMPKLLLAAPGVTWEFHGHCNNSFGPVNALEFVKLGIKIIHTAIPPLANANSQPSIYNLAENLRATGYEPKIHEDILRPATEYLIGVAKTEKFQIGIPYEYDERLYHHQVPGGMISNLVYQLSLVGMAHLIDAVLEEIPLVRAELGYPIMVTPLSQIVGSQAAINVIVGERYAQVSDALIEYALGRHGSEALVVMDQNVRNKILDRPRAKELQTLEPWEPTLKELRQKYGRAISDEDLILLSIVGEDALDVVGMAANTEAVRVSHEPLSALVRNLTTSDSQRFVSWKGKGWSVKIIRAL